MDYNLQEVTGLLGQLVIKQSPPGPFDENEFIGLGGGGGFSACGDVGSGGFSGGDDGGGSGGYDFTGWWPWSSNGGSFICSAGDRETNTSSLQSTGTRTQESTTRPQPESSSREVGKKGAANDDHEHHHQSSGHVRDSPLGFYINPEHHKDTHRRPEETQIQDTPLSTPRNSRPGLECRGSLEFADGEDFGTALTTLLENEFGNLSSDVCHTAESYPTVKAPSLDFSQRLEYGRHQHISSPRVSAEHHTTSQPSSGPGIREEATHQSIPGDIPCLNNDLESRVCREDGDGLCSSALEEPKDLTTHEEQFVSPDFQHQPTKPLKLACPYFKFDPETYGQRRTCRGTAYDTTHRLKEHLYRSHRQKPRCLRCGEIFSQNSDKKKHLSQPVACNVVEGITADGFDSDQEKELRSKKRKRNNLKTEEDKWGHIFRILFGDSVAVPQPYYTYPIVSNARSDSQSGRNDLLKMTMSDVERVISQDVPRDLEEQTFSQVEAISGHPLPRAKRRQMLGIFRRLFFKQLTGANEPANSKEDVNTGNGPGSNFCVNNMAGTSGIDSSTMPTHGAQQFSDSRSQTMTSAAYGCDRIFSSQTLSLGNEIVEGRTSTDGGQAVVHSTSGEANDGYKYGVWPTSMSLGVDGNFNWGPDDFWAIASMNGFPT